MARFEFEARLRIELRGAAERAQRRGLLARLVAAGRSLLLGVGHSSVPAVAVVATLAAAIAVAALFLMSDSEQRPVAPPEVVAELTLADSLGSTVGAFGSVWMADTSRDELLRVDPDSRRVGARLPVAGEVAIAVGAGALWALQEGQTRKPRGGFALHRPLLRIAPARIALPLASRSARHRAALRGLRGARRTGRGLGRGGQRRTTGRSPNQPGHSGRRAARPAGQFPLRALDGDLWAITADGRLLRFDTRTGDTVSDVRLALPGARDLSNGPGDALIATAPGALARVEPYSGRVLWRTRLGGRVDVWTAAGGLIWVRSSGQGHDRLSALDPDTGRVLTTVELDDFGGAGLAAIDDELWLTTVGGSVVVLRR